ncbi:MAG: cytochrome C oxidase subunit IV family protein [Elusimicrobia bacterium]|nr:cytochrome C oxidase subunit IV family protein [Elusimicrobiota bacterium]
MNDMEHGQGHIVEAAILLKVWGALLALTGLLVGASLVSPTLAVAAMLTLTPIKAWLVLYYFMHIKYEGPLLRGMVLIALSVLVIFIGMMFLDLAFR